MRTCLNAAAAARLPRGGVIALCALVLALPAGLAVSHSLRYDSQSRWLHQHTTSYSTCVAIDGDAQLRDRSHEARVDWHNLAPETGVSLPLQSDCHPAGGTRARLELRDGRYGNVGWRASAWDASTNEHPAGYHNDHTHLQFNLDALSGSNVTSYVKRTLACRTIGAGLGLDIAPGTEGSNNDCMSFQGSITGERSKQDYPTNYTYSNAPGSHSISALANAYGLGGQVPSHGPRIALSGPLVEAAAAGTLRESSYELAMSATEGPLGPGPGITSITVSVDGQAQSDGTFTQSCPAGGCTMQRSWTFDADRYAAGTHTVTVSATDSLGMTTSKALSVSTGSARGGGRLNDYSFEELELDDGSALAVNIANGNLLHSAEDLRLFGEESDLVLERHYNSRVRRDGAFGPGWSMGLADVRLEINGDGTRELLGPSGYRAVFTPDGTGGFRTDAGVAASLRAVGPMYELYLHEDGDTWTFDASGALQKQQEAGGEELSFSYSGGRLAAVTNSAGGDVALTYNARGDVATATATPGGVHMYQYDSGGNLVKHVDPSGNESVYSYAGGNLVGIRRMGTQLATLSYDASRRATTILGGSGASRSFAYAGNETTVSGGLSPGIFTSVGTEIVSARAGTAPPSLTLSGSLRTTAPQLAATGSYTLEMTTADTDGVAEVRLLVNGEQEDLASCSASCAAYAHTFTIYPEEFLPGRYRITAKALDASGSWRSETFEVEVPPSGTASGPADEPDASQTLVEQATDFREAFGLRSDAAWVEATLSNPAYAESADVWSVPLTPEEEAEMESRLELSEEVDELVDYGGDDAPADYAGAWIDQEAGGIVHVAFTGNQAQHAAAIGAFFEHPEALVIDGASNTLAELDATHDALAADMDDLEANGLEVVQIATDVVDNEVEVGLVDPASGDEQQLNQLYSAPVDVFRAEPAVTYGGGRDSKVRPLQAGLVIRTAGSQCILGFGARRVGDSPPHRWYALTAGHCGGEGTVVRQGGVRIGTIDESVQAGSVDVARIRIQKGVRPRRVYKTSSLAHPVARVRDERRRALQSQGEMVCTSGTNYDDRYPAKDYSCGVINKADVTVRRGDGVTLDHVACSIWSDGLQSQPGYSGAPMFDKFRQGGRVRATAIGILWGGALPCAKNDDGVREDGTFFSHLHFIENRLNVETVKAK